MTIDDNHYINDKLIIRMLYSRMIKNLNLKQKKINNL